MHASSSSRPYAATRTSLAMTGPKPRLIDCRPAHVCVLFAYDELLVRDLLAFPFSSIWWHLLNSILSCICPFANIARLLFVRDQGYAPSAHPCLPRSFTREQRCSAVYSPSRALSPGPRNHNTSDSYQCDVPLRVHHRYRYLHPIAQPVPCWTQRIHRRGRCLAHVLCSMLPSAWATLSSSACPTVFNATGLSRVRQFPLPPLPFPFLPHH
jgi:hypothetical protein